MQIAAPQNRSSPSLDRKIGVGELGIARERGMLRTLLGSCIGLVLHDHVARAGGLAHIVLPKSDGAVESLGKYADTAIPELIRLIQEAGGRPERLVARFAGGANMFATKLASIGDQNVSMVEYLLKEARIPIRGQDCGGGQGRRMTYDVESGVVMVEIVGNPPVQL